MTAGIAAPPIRLPEKKLISSKLRLSIGIEVVLFHLAIFIGPFLYTNYLNSKVPEDNLFRVKLVGPLSVGEEVGPPQRLRPGTPPPPQIPANPVQEVAQPQQPALPVRQVEQPTQPALPVRQVAQPAQPVPPTRTVTQPTVPQSQRERIAAETLRRAQAQMAEAQRITNEAARRQQLLDAAKRQQAAAQEAQRKAAATAAAAEAQRKAAAERDRQIAEAHRLANVRGAGGSNTNIAVPIGDSDRAQTPGKQNNATPGGGAEGETQAYWDRLKRYLDTKWVEPPDSLLNGARPTVIILLTVAADGRVTSGRITQSSGNRVMDDYAKRFLDTLDRVPTPQAGGYSLETKLTIKN